MLNKLLILTVLSAACFAQDYEEYQPTVRQSHSSGASRYQQEEPKKEPIAILKQINKHNEDGSYTYGYEGADGSFKIETKAANGDVKGQYGYVDADGKVRTVEYGADKYGFQPSGEGITVAPINFNDVKDYEEEQQQQYAQAPKAPKAARPQYNYAPAVVEKRKPVFATTQAPQYYDYEDEVATTPRPIQIARPKYAAPAPPQPRPQYDENFQFAFAPEQRPARPAAQYQQLVDTRQPVQFPAETESPVPQVASRAEQFSLFSPAASRADTYKPQFNQFAQEPSYQQYAPQPQASQPQAPKHQQRPAAPRPAFASRPAQSRSTSVLDQLANDPLYSLPQSSPALHDISFGYSV